MELRQLEYFVAVAEEGSITKGAQRVRVAQSAVSATMQKLERELGQPLFSRQSTRITLTDAGTALLPEARALLSAERRARDTVDQVRGGLRGTIRIGTLVSIGARPASQGVLVIDLPQILGRFHVTHPLVAFQLRTAPNGSAGHPVRDRGRRTRPRAGRHRRSAGRGPPASLGTVRWSFVCARRHRLADASSVTLDDLADETFIDFPHGWGNRTMTDRAFAGAGIVRDIPFEAADRDTALGLVRNGLGVTLLPRPGSADPDISVVDVEGADLDLPVSLATPSERQPSAATAALLTSILRAAEA